MSRITVLVGCLAVWGVLCLFIHRLNRHAAWLAGATTAAGLFLTGATVAASFMSTRAPYLLPFWLGVAMLLVWHLRAARRAVQCELEGASIASGQLGCATTEQQSGSTVI